ncbi:hypothetical protein BCR44DRAFT_1197181 [Catenaria anguillulae PL171]|uniref:Uncharacterized protein n=1 Tax=Catenaria anguillulae PL171 TaxID=765915 RepID=A0A1Y2H1X8_9FUNG|nr:hypothetical protein BCR44DRAFT_1197181 [Catenaria anguillulae PL171]
MWRASASGLLDESGLICLSVRLSVSGHLNFDVWPCTRERDAKEDNSRFKVARRKRTAAVKCAKSWSMFTLK